MDSRAFTLIEMLAAVAVMVLLAALAGVSLRGAVAQASFEDVLQRIADYDAGARAYAARFGRPLVMRFESRGIEQRPASEDEEVDLRAPLQLPTGYELRLIPAAASVDETVRLSTAGRSRSYAVELTGRNGRRGWLLVAGLTGHSTTWEDEAAATAAIVAMQAGEYEDLEDDGDR